MALPGAPGRSTRSHEEGDSRQRPTGAIEARGMGQDPERQHHPRLVGSTHHVEPRQLGRDGQRPRAQLGRDGRVVVRAKNQRSPRSSSGRATTVPTGLGSRCRGRTGTRVSKLRRISAACEGEKSRHMPTAIATTTPSRYLGTIVRIVGRVGISGISGLPWWSRYWGMASSPGRRIPDQGGIRVLGTRGGVLAGRRTAIASLNARRRCSACRSRSGMVTGSGTGSGTTSPESMAGSGSRRATVSSSSDASASSVRSRADAAGWTTSPLVPFVGGSSGRDPGLSGLGMLLYLVLPTGGHPDPSRALRGRKPPARRRRAGDVRGPTRGDIADRHGCAGDRAEPEPRSVEKPRRACAGTNRARRRTRSSDVVMPRWGIRPRRRMVASYSTSGPVRPRPQDRLRVLADLATTMSRVEPQLQRHDEGQTLADYALILSLVVIVAVCAALVLERDVNRILSTVGSAL